MNVIVNGQFYDANKVPILYLPSDEDKFNISNMGSAKKYFCFPSEWEKEVVEQMIEEFKEILEENEIK